MPITISNSSGDGMLSSRLDTDIEMPDSGGLVSVVGTVQAAGVPVVSVTGSPVSAPPPPVAGALYWAIEANLTTGQLSVSQSTAGVPSADAGCIALFVQTLMPGQVDDALAGADSTPDTN